MNQTARGPGAAMNEREGISPNLAALQLTLYSPEINPVLFRGLNGYLVGRGYLDVVALGRLDAAGGEESAPLPCRGHPSWG